MLSGQADRLRDMADVFDAAGIHANTVCELRDAADTITELRGALSIASIDYRHLSDENTKLRDENARLRSCLSDDAENAQLIMGENAELRELAERAYKAARMMCEAWEGPCQSNSDVPSWRVPCPTDERDEQCVFGQLERDMRELGVEVDG